MILQFYTILKLCEEFKKLIGMEVIEAFSQEKDTLIIGFADEENQNYLNISTDNKYSSIYLIGDFARANKNSIDLFEEMKGEILQDIIQVNNDRIIKLSFVKFDLICELFGRGRSNVVLVNKDCIIINSLENKSELTGNIYTYPKKFLNSKLETIEDYLKRRPNYITNDYLTEFCEINSINKKNKLTEYNEVELEKLDYKINIFRDKLIKSKINYLYKQNHKYIFSLIKLTITELVKESENISELIRYKISLSKRDEEFKAAKSEIDKTIKSKLKRVKSNFDNAQMFEKSLLRAELYKNYADILISDYRLKDRLGSELKTYDFEGNEVIIKLDDKLTILENSQIYYEKSKKAEKEAKIKKEMLEKAKLKYNEIKNISSEFELINDLKTLKKFKQKYKEEFPKMNRKEKQNQESRFRHFNLDGYDFYVGRNAANNDELTMKYAKPNDLWFHARGLSGSHCIIRVSGREKVPKDILQKAAGISAYYSSARKAKHVPVAYTEKKYVRKPKGANIGAVIIQKEKVIFADPLDPHNL